MTYRFSAQAGRDMDEISSFTFGTWGPLQTDKYLAEFEDTFDLLAKMPAIGRLVKVTARGGRRFEHGSHVIFYRETRTGILIRRVLHKKMLVTLHMG